MINRSVKYLSKVCNKKYQPLSLKQVKWALGEVLSYRHLMRVYYEANGYDINPAIERDSETNLPLLFEYGLPAKNREGKDCKIPVRILYNDKATYNTAAFAIQEEGQTENEVIYAMLYRIINMGVTCQEESKKLETANHEKIAFEFFLGDLVIAQTVEGKNILGLPIRYVVKEKK